MTTDHPEKQQVIQKLKHVESQIDILSKLKKKLLSELDCVITNNTSCEKATQPSSILTKEEKIHLFKNLFRGRDDVYARLWISKKTGKKGYSPVCRNEWVTNVCKKPRIKCVDCSVRELVPLTKDIVLKHLDGQCVIGVYPMLKNEHCYFLAADFDKGEWFEDVTAFKKTCVDSGIPIAIERSQSGNGAHAWIFFSEDIPASMARKLGSILISKTMANRYQMDMKSYDRLFPNQDTLPQGGFGNLIALPLQKQARKYGNSVFINEDGQPYENQWQYLATLKKMSYSEVEQFVEQNQEEDIRESPQEENDSPWLKLPSGESQRKANIVDMPNVVDLVIANCIYIKTEGVPSAVLNQLKRLASFHNPEFYKRQNMRFSTHATPRIICCAEIIDGYLALPRGCLTDICSVLGEHKVRINLEDKTFEGQKNKFKFNGQLTKEQKKAARKIVKQNCGILVAPPGVGKTVLAISMIAKRKINVLILVHRKPLMEQWRLQTATFLEIDVKDIGQIGSGKNKSFGIIDIAMIQSMERKGVVDDRIADYGFIIIDECHHIGAVSFERVMMQVKAKYILGLTATPYRRDGHQPIIHMQCGQVIAEIKQKDIDNNISKLSIKLRNTEFLYQWSDESKIHEVWTPLIENKLRNNLITSDIIKALHEGRFPLILTERKAHLELLAEALKNNIDYLAILHGGVKAKKRKEILEEFKMDTNGKSKALLAIGAYIGEGFDDPRLDTLFLTMPISFKGKVIQYAGRLHREFEGKTDVQIYDYVDEKVPILSSMFKKRLKTYKAIGYEINTGDKSE